MKEQFKEQLIILIVFMLFTLGFIALLGVLLL